MPVKEFFTKPIDTEDCWEWSLTVDSQGYGRMPDGERVHRVAHILWKGPIPEGTEIDHLCRNRRCWNPDHIEAVPHRINARRGNAPPAQNARKTHCVHGHEFSPENTYSPPGTNKRECRSCHRRNSRAHYHASRQVVT